MDALVLINGAPYGTATPAEAYRTAIGLGGMGVDTAVVLVEDGVWVAVKGHNPKVIDMQDLSQAFGALNQFDVKLYVLKEALEERGISENELIKNDGIITMEDLKKMIKEAKCVLTFLAGG
ncbi:MAG: hypothetical protein DRQ10_06350 [Candidatus Hydrothermota bacterium]|nr:MAG: hypothetical protein DRQ10_06350 [Candidatus Hydrothermae bacterium]